MKVGIKNSVPRTAEVNAIISRRRSSRGGNGLRYLGALFASRQDASLLRSPDCSESRTSRDLVSRPQPKSQRRRSPSTSTSGHSSFRRTTGNSSSTRPCSLHEANDNQDSVDHCQVGDDAGRKNRDGFWQQPVDHQRRISSYRSSDSWPSRRDHGRFRNGDYGRPHCLTPGQLVCESRHALSLIQRPNFQSILSCAKPQSNFQR